MEILVIIISGREITTKRTLLQCDVSSDGKLTEAAGSIPSSIIDPLTESACHVLVIYQFNSSLFSITMCDNELLPWIKTQCQYDYQPE